MTFVLFRHGQHLLLLLNGVRKPFLVRTHMNRAAYRLLKTSLKKRRCAQVVAGCEKLLQKVESSYTFCNKFPLPATTLFVAKQVIRGGKTDNTAFQFILQQCYKTSC